MNVTFYNFSKRRNSTAQPTGGTSYNCVLKEGTSTSRPEIMIKWQGGGAPSAYNYAYIPAFVRYYWVNSWTYEDRCWTASCSVDVLATYKTAIGSSSKYVLRSASNYDADMIDTLYPAKATFKTASQVLSNPYANSIINGYYILSISGGGSTGVDYIQVNPSNLETLINYCYQETANIWGATVSTSDFGEALQTYGENMAKSVYNPFQYINSAMWVPASFGGTSYTGLKLGPLVASGVTYTKPTKPWNEIVESFTVPTISATYEWEKVAPYRQYQLHIPPFGEISLDATQMRDISTVNVSTIYDYVSGGATATVYGTTSGGAVVYLARVSGQIGIPIALASNSVDNLGALSAQIGAASSVAGGIASILTGNIGGAVSAVGGVASSAIAGYAASAPKPQQTGVTGGIGYLRQSHILHVLQYDRPDTDEAEFGQPLYKVKTLNTLSGYVKCADGEVACNANEEEHSQLEAFLTGGFFYE